MPLNPVFYQQTNINMDLKRNKNSITFGHIIAGYANPTVRTLMNNSIIHGDFASVPETGCLFLKSLQTAVKKYVQDNDVYKSLRDFYSRVVGNDVSCLNYNDKRVLARVKAIKILMGNSFSPKTYTDIGCGNAKITEGIAKAFNIPKDKANGLDVFLYPAKDVDVSVRKFDGVNIPLEKKSQDLVSLFTVFHHVENPSNLLTNIREALSPKGKLVIREFNAKSPEENRFNLIMDEMLYKVYNDYPDVPISENYIEKKQLETKLGKFGFKCDKVMDDTTSDTKVSKNPYQPFYAVFSKSS
jgi:ubiquinone/menaquinone biosynthesis C-methylase UbiE